jgi:hypothetical protein
VCIKSWSVKDACRGSLGRSVVRWNDVLIATAWESVGWKHFFRDRDH